MAPLMALTLCVLPASTLAAGRDLTRVAFRIPSQALDEALLTLARQADVQLAAAGELDLARRSGEVSGVMSLDAALTRLLAGTGYSYEVRADGVVIVIRGAQRASSPSPAMSAPAVTELSTLVVTARRRDERWIDVPMAVSVLGGEELDALGVDNVADAVGLASGVTAIDTGAAFTQVQIRGVSSSLGGNDNGYYLDDIPFTGLTVPWHPDTRIYDVERVEVLKGPQGTLFGEGSMGGTVRVVTRPPSLTTREASVQLGVNSTQGGGAGRSFQSMANVPLISDTLALRVVASSEVLPGWVDAPGGDEDVNEQRILTQRLRLRWVPDDRWMTDFNYSHRETDAPGGDYAANDLLMANFRLATKSRWHGLGISSQYAFDSSRLMVLQSHTELITDMDGPVTPTAELNGKVDISAENTEVRWASTGGGPLDWQVGMSRRIARRHDEIVAGGALAADRSVNRASAIFGEVTLRGPGARWSMAGGLRYFDEKISSNASSNASSNQTSFVTRTDSARLIPRLSMGWHLSDDGLIYAGVATGFRSGQVQPAASAELAESAGIDVPTYIEPDVLTSYELGFKQVLANGRMHMQGSLFHSRWRKLPVRVPVDELYNALTNSNGALIRGAEFEIRYQPDESLDVGLSVTYTDAHYVSEVPGTDIQAGMDVYNVPRINLSGTARYGWQLRSTEASVATTLRYHSARETGLLGRSYSGDPILALDLRFGLEGRRWGWFLYGDNLTNEDGALDGRTTFGQAIRLHPRSLGLEVQYRF